MKKKKKKNFLRCCLVWWLFLFFSLFLTCSVLCIYMVVFTFGLFIRTQINKGLFQMGSFDVEREEVLYQGKFFQ